MAVHSNLRPTHFEKTVGPMKVEFTVKRITFDRTEARPGKIGAFWPPQFNIDVSGHENSVFVQNVTQALVEVRCEMFRHHSPRYCGLRHLKILRGPFPFEEQSSQKAAAGSSE